MMTGNAVPMTASGPRPRRRMPGCEITPPPTPNRPESTPMATPRSTKRASRASPGSISAPTRSGLRGLGRVLGEVDRGGGPPVAALLRQLLHERDRPRVLVAGPGDDRAVVDHPADDLPA